MGIRILALLSALFLVGCAATTDRAPLSVNVPLTTTAADRFTCSGNASLVCHEVLGSRVSRKEQDCVCTPN